MYVVLPRSLRVVLPVIDHPFWTLLQERYRLINKFYDTLARDDQRQSRRALHQYPTYGDARSVWARSAFTKEDLATADIHGPDLHHFYAFWTKFESSKEFEWVIKYDETELAQYGNPRFDRYAFLL